MVSSGLNPYLKNYRKTKPKAEAMRPHRQTGICTKGVACKYGSLINEEYKLELNDCHTFADNIYLYAKG